MEHDAQTLRLAKQQAYRLLSYRSQTSRELRDRLQRRGYTTTVIDAILQQLADEGYIDDRKFAFDWARYRLQAKPLGPRRLAWELERRGVPLDAVQEVLGEVYSEVDEVTLAEHAIRKRPPSKDMLQSIRERQRYIRYLMGLGFEVETITTVLKKVSSSLPPLESDGA